MIRAVIESLRPRHYTKNLLLFVGVIFSQHFFSIQYLLKSAAAFVVFCLLSGSVYLLNDLADIENDRAHPEKNKRPLASGRLGKRPAVITIIILSVSSLTCAFLLDVSFGIISSFYFVMIVAYSFLLKNIVILDIMVIALGFILRAVAGALVIHVDISSWLLICTTFLALFLAMCKRRHELVLLGNKSGNHRKILFEYTPQLLDQMIAAVTASAVMSYALYTTSPETIEKFSSRNMILTLPFVIYGIFRYLYLVHKKQLGGSPEMIFIRDRSMILNVFLFFIVVLIVLYVR